MSRVAKKPVNLPKGVELNIQPESVSVKGPKGTLSLPKVAGIEISVADGVATLSASNDEGITLSTPTQTEILVQGTDKQLVGEVAAKIRGYRPPEPYKGKGVKYAGEVIIRKEAKKA